MDHRNEEKILQTWQKNSEAWTKAVRNHKITSRIETTNNAIVEAVLSHQPNSVLDIGCGEGWLVKKLEEKKVFCLGIDATKSLINEAKKNNLGHFKILEYGELAENPNILEQKFDVLVSNFALLGKESVEQLFSVAKWLLNPKGVFIIQTLHPWSACTNFAYKNQWRKGSWKGFGKEFRDPAPWYFRTLESWIQLFKNSGFRDLSITEPMNMHSHEPISIIFSGIMYD